MTIRKGERWGSEGSLPPGSPVVRSDADLRAVVEPSLSAGNRPATVGLLAGDLCRTVGGPGDEARLRDGGVVLSIDAVRVAIDGVEHWFCSHLVARRRLWWGRAVVVMNAQWLGTLKLGPRAHPNDGLIDATDGTLPWSDRSEARRRARSGTHVPHPALTVRRASHHEFTFDPPTAVWLDGTRVATAARHLLMTVHADAFNVVV
jgi:hypothetical protein